MQTIITKQVKANNSTFLEITCGKTSAEIAITDQTIWVVCKNAAHQVWGGMGKRFDSFDAAISSYKSSAMKSILETAQAVAI
jgi:hypothetical protein